MIQQFQVEGFDKNFSYVIVDTQKKQGMCVDPCGSYKPVLDYIDENNIQIIGVLITHGHFDHIEHVQEVARRFNAPVYAHENATLTLPERRIEELKEGSELLIGSICVRVLHTKGHTSDSACFYIEYDEDEQAPVVITGDTLFVEGCGRTDQDGVKDLYESLERLKTLPPNTKVYSGHDYGSIPVSTIAHELEHNRFYKVASYDEFVSKRLPS